MQKLYNPAFTMITVVCCLPAAFSEQELQLFQRSANLGLAQLSGEMITLTKYITYGPQIPAWKENLASKIARCGITGKFSPGKNVN